MKTTKEPFPWVMIAFTNDFCNQIALMERFPNEDIAVIRAKHLTKNGNYWTSVYHETQYFKPSEKL